ncbi:hypothetical protein [Actinoplanes sp. NPDC026623]|uniref:hypothetical protein n=1 Tax=Actinoplanes sp. NPDC026623 TaxID=3155610 RepID=UPI0033EF6775
MDELDARPALETVRDFLGANVADAENFDEIRADQLQLAQVSTRAIRRDLAALEALLADPPSSPGSLARLVGWEGNWVLDDPSDAAAAQFLRDLATVLRNVLDEASRTGHP